MRKDAASHNNDWMRGDSLPNIVEHQFHPIDEKALFDVPRSTHKPRVLMLMDHAASAHARDWLP